MRKTGNKPDKILSEGNCQKKTKVYIKQELSDKKDGIKATAGKIGSIKNRELSEEKVRMWVAYKELSKKDRKYTKQDIGLEGKTGSTYIKLGAF